MTHENRGADYLEHVLIACNRVLFRLRKIEKERFMQDFEVHDVVIRAITVAGEAAKRIRTKSPQLTEEHDLYAFMELIGMRNVLIHDYDGVNLHVAWQTATEDIPRLRQKVLTVLATLGRTVDPDVLHFQ